MRTLIFFALFASACVPVAVPVARVSHDASVVFGPAVLGVTATVELEVINTGAAASEVFASVPAPFAVPSAAFRIPAQGSAAITLAFTAPDYEVAVADLILVVDGSERHVAVTAHALTDADGDGFDAVATGGDDCDDLRADVYPLADEFCDGRDGDCDGSVDEDALDVFPSWIDADSDGFGTGTATNVCSLPVGSALVDGDCDDAAADIAPNVTEVFYDGVDADCLGDSDYDADSDGYDALDYGGQDCDDLAIAVHPGATDIPYDGVDTDCGGGSDFDADGDGFDAEAFGGADCNDATSTQAPGLLEVEDGLDQDCDFIVDEGFVVAGDWVISELMLRPTATSGQWVEVINMAASERNLAGLQIMGSESQRLEAVPAAPSERLVLCADGDPLTNGGVTTCSAVLDPWPGDAFALALRSATLDAVDTSTWAKPAGASLELPVGLDDIANDLESAWCTATAAYGEGDLGSPALGPSCP